MKNLLILALMLTFSTSGFSMFSLQGNKLCGKLTAFELTMDDTPGDGVPSVVFDIEAGNKKVLRTLHKMGNNKYIGCVNISSRSATFGNDYIVVEKITLKAIIN